MSPLATRIAARVQREPSTWVVEAYPPVPASEAAVDQAERTIGHRLPAVIRELYTRVRNGTFGPAGGLLPVGGKVGWNLGLTIEASYESLRDYGKGFDEPSWVWPPHFVPLCHWGCEIWSCADCASDPAPVVRWDPNGMGRDDFEWRRAFDREAESVEQWLEAWLDGRLKQWPLLAAEQRAT
jgi:hypothetical protein